MKDHDHPKFNLSIHPLPGLLCLFFVALQAFSSSFPVVCVWIAILISIRFAFRLDLDGLLKAIVLFLKIGASFIPFSLLRTDASFHVALSPENLSVLAMTLARMFEAWLIQELFFSACKLDDLRHFLDTVTGPFKPCKTTGLHLAITISFIPYIVRCWTETEQGYVLRAGKSNPAGRLKAVAGAVTRKMLVRSRDISDNLRVTCPRYEPGPWIDRLEKKDLAAAAMAAAALMSSFS